MFDVGEGYSLSGAEKYWSPLTQQYSAYYIKNTPNLLSDSFSDSEYGVYLVRAELSEETTSDMADVSVITSVAGIATLCLLGFSLARRNVKR